jgi:hypothetical protein
LDGIVNKVRTVISSISGKVNKALDFVAGKATKLVQPIFEKLKAGASKVQSMVSNGVDKAKQKGGELLERGKQFINGIFGKKTFQAGGEQHSVWVEVSNDTPRLMIASTPREARAQIAFYEQQARKEQVYDLVSPSIDRARAAVAKAIVKLKGLTDSKEDRKSKGRALSQMDSVVDGTLDSVKDMLTQLRANGKDAALLKINFNARLLRNDLWPDGGRPDWAADTLQHLRDEFKDAHKPNTTTLKKGYDRRHIEAFDDIVKRRVLEINGRSYTQATDYLTAKGFPPASPTLEPIKTGFKGFLKKDFNEKANLWVGPSKPNQLKGSEFSAAEQQMQTLDPKSPEHRAQLERRSKAASDPAPGKTQGCVPLGDDERGYITTIRGVSEKRIQRLLKAQPGTPPFEEAQRLYEELILSKRKLGDFTNLCSRKDANDLTPVLERAGVMIYQLATLF